ncbi:hypothetical protein [Staphylococcus casei]|uniref:Phage protein n=1 Tax=Staphylococcus casei TaxID=201828 RepID=A0ABZ2WBL3_9STAP
MKIKTKKQMTLEEYAKYMIDNYGVSGYESELIDENIIGGPMRFAQTIELNPILKKDLPNKVFRNGKMIVEVEEEITEETIIPKMLVIGRFDGYEEVYNRKISHFNQHLLSAYLIDDDGRMELLYDEVKGIVE